MRPNRLGAGRGIMCFGHRENKRWQQCQHVFKKAEERGVEINLNVIMVKRTVVDKGIYNMCFSAWHAETR